MRVDHDFSLELSIVEHFVSCAKVSSLKVFLVGTMTKEEVVRDTFSQVAYIN
jgi:hypothetical protein